MTSQWLIVGCTAGCFWHCSQYLEDSQFTAWF